MRAVNDVPAPVRISPPRPMPRPLVAILALVATSWLSLLSAVALPLIQAPQLGAPLEIDAYAMQEGLLASVVPVALSTVVARDEAAIYVATNVAVTEQRMEAVATQVRRDSLNNVDTLSTRVVLLDAKLDRALRHYPSPTPNPVYVPGPPAGYFGDTGP